MFWLTKCSVFRSQLQFSDEAEPVINYDDPTPGPSSANAQTPTTGKFKIVATHKI